MPTTMNRVCRVRRGDRSFREQARRRGTDRSALRALLAVALSAAAANVQANPPPPLPRDDQAASDLREIVGDGFRVRQTDHFAIAYNTTHDTVSDLVNRLEGTFDAIWRFCEGLGLPIIPPDKRLVVLFFDKPEEFARFCADAGFTVDSLAGIYQESINWAVFSNTLNRGELQEATRRMDQIQARLRELSADRSKPRSSRERRKRLVRELGVLRSQRDALVERFNRFVIHHEATHQMLFNIGVHVRGGANPVWLAEGLACQFEVPQARSGSGLRRVNHIRLADLRDALRLSPSDRRLSEDQYRRAFFGGRLVPLVDLVGDRELFYGKKADLNVLYAEAWALVYYLQREHREAFADYVGRLAARRPGQAVDPRGELADFEAVFGPLDDEFQLAWITYVVRLRLNRKEAGR